MAMSADQGGLKGPGGQPEREACPSFPVPPWTLRPAPPGGVGRRHRRGIFADDSFNRLLDETFREIARGMRDPSLGDSGPSLVGNGAAISLAPSDGPEKGYPTEENDGPGRPGGEEPERPTHQRRAFEPVAT
jgi:hypothetical protein